jgi:hypothetical protein
MSQVQASHLMKFSQKAKLLGNGLVVIDFGSRVGNIRNSYQAGENWERELFVESSSFVAGAIIGNIAINAGSAALSFLVIATPIGWVGLVAAGITVAALGAGVSIVANNITKTIADKNYDRIIKMVNNL